MLAYQFSILLLSEMIYHYLACRNGINYWCTEWDYCPNVHPMNEILNVFRYKTSELIKHVEARQ